MDWGDAAGWAGFGLGLWSNIKIYKDEFSARKITALNSLIAELKALEHAAIDYFLRPEQESSHLSTTILATVRNIGMELNHCSKLLDEEVSKDWIKLRQAITGNDFQSTDRPVYAVTSERIRHIQGRASAIIAAIYLKLKELSPLK